VPFTGHWPFFDDGAYQGRRDLYRYAAIGPLTRHAEDLMPTLRALAGPDGFDQTTSPMPLGDERKVSWKGRKVLLLANPRIRGASRTTPELVEAARNAAEVLRHHGAEIVEADEALFVDAFNIWAATLDSLDAPKLHLFIGGGKKPKLTRELVSWMLGKPNVTLPALEYCLAEGLFTLVKKEQYVEKGRALKARVDELLGEDGVILMPTHPRVAPKHNAPMLRPLDHAYTGIFNILRYPVTTVPTGLDFYGLPMGVQIAAREGQDHVTIAAALRLEEALGGWQPAMEGKRLVPERAAS
jgi:fatty acid amide hydrolase 2